MKVFFSYILAGFGIIFLGLAFGNVAWFLLKSFIKTFSDLFKKKK